MGTKKIVSLATPTADTDASTKKYVDDLHATRAATLSLGAIGRVPFASSTSALTTDSNFTFGSSLLSVPTITTTGNVIVGGTGAITIPSGTTNQRGTAAQGMLRYNTTTNEFEGYSGSWGSIGGGGGATVGGANTQIQYNNSGSLAGSANLTFDGTNLTCGGNITAYSDKRLKTNITTISEPNEKLKKINGYEFDWKEKDGKHDIGVIAQEIEEVIPEIVINNGDGYKSVDYGRIVALLIESNKELLKRVEDLESKISSSN